MYTFSTFVSKSENGSSAFSQKVAPQGYVMFETNNYFYLELSEHKNGHFEWPSWNKECCCLLVYLLQVASYFTGTSEWQSLRLLKSCFCLRCFFSSCLFASSVPSVDTSFLPYELTTNVASKRPEKMASLNTMVVTSGRKRRQAMCGQKPDIGVLLSDHNFISSSLVLFPSSFLFFFCNNIIFTKL